MVATTQIPTKTVNEVRNAAVSFAATLDDSELLTGTPTVTATPSGLTFASPKVNTAAIEVEGQSVAIGKAAQFSVSGGEHGKTYVIRVSVGTTATPAQTLEAICNLRVIF